MRRRTFEEFLQDEFMGSSYADGLSKDQFEDAYVSWASDLEVGELIQYGEEYGESLEESSNKKI